MVFNRIYSDYLMPNRLNALRDIYVAALDAGYEMHSVISFWDEVVNGRISVNKKYFINRHDIDTDVGAANLIFNIERQMGIKSSFYFRLNTLDYDLMLRIEGFGGEASYHFEEIASLGKKYKWKNVEDVNFCLAKSEFANNFNKIKNATCLPMRSVCSHGDFLNRRLGVINNALLDQRLRNELGIEVEAYDYSFVRYIQSRHSDAPYPKYYVPEDPISKIKEGVGVIYFLTHPRHWRVNWVTNTKDNLLRLYEGLNYKFG